MLSFIGQFVLSTTILELLLAKFHSALEFSYITYFIPYIHIIESLGISGIITIT